MKFCDMPYEHLDYPAIFAQIDAHTAAFCAAKDAKAQLDVYFEMERLSAHLETQTTICSIRNSVDTRDAYYEAEQAYHDEHMPLLEEKLQAFDRALYQSAFRAQLEQKLGALVFKNIELSLKSFSPAVIPLMQEENRLCTAYQKLYASAKIDFDGKCLTVAQLGPYKESTDRKVRRAALEAEGGFFDAHQAEFDELFDKLVQNRTQQAHKLGLPDYVELSRYRRQRNCYGPEEIARFRGQVVRDLVPLTLQMKKGQAARIGVPDFKFYDNPLIFKGGSVAPHGTPEQIMAAGKQMYTELSPDTAKFIARMFDMDLFDVLAKPGKAPGGFCACLPDYHASFIFSNFNGTSGDVDVLTHEAGHAFADYICDSELPIRAHRQYTSDTAETHSMSMEFLTAPWHKLFFAQDTQKYEVAHAEAALAFIPYGCLVDHFQEQVYRHPEWTPGQRNQRWLELEGLYRPYIDFDGLPFYSRGAGWQRQLHIYVCPFYYIEYCIAQAMSLQFFSLSLEDHAAAWEKYMAFVRQGGKHSFVDTVHSVGLQSPLDEGCVKAACDKTWSWLQQNPVA